MRVVFSKYSILAASLLGVTAIGGCLPVSDFGDTGTTAESISVTAGMTATSAPGTTTSSDTLSSSTTDPTSPNTATPTCSILCGTDEPTNLDCDIFAQDCPDGEKCAAVIPDGGSNWDSARCVPVTGTDMPGEPCTAEAVADGLDSCIKGAMCWEVDKDGNGICRHLCTGTPDAPICPDQGICSIGSDFLALCFPNCDPLLQDCVEGAACYPINDGFDCARDASGDTGKANDLCEFVNACDSGLLCAGPEFVGAGCPPGSMGCCTPFCEFPAGACPNPDQQCVQWFDPAMLPEGDPQLDIGYCGVPQ
jgi:hypothetical protein